MFNRIFANINSYFSLITVKHSFYTSALSLVLLLAFCSAFSKSYAYTLQGPRYGSSPAVKKEPQAPVETTVSNTQKELSAEELAVIEEQNEFILQIQNSINPNPELENKEIEQIIASGETPLLMYGSTKLDKFLGCLNCHPKFSISIWNTKGPYGSSRGNFSVWNTLFEFGNVKSNVCPWNLFASNPPAVIDPKGNFYGFLTSNSAINSHYENNFTLTLLMDFQDIGLNAQKWFEDTFASQLTHNPNTIDIKDLQALPKPVPKEDRLYALKPEKEPIVPKVERRPFTPYEPQKTNDHNFQTDEHNHPFTFP